MQMLREKKIDYLKKYKRNDYYKRKFSYYKFLKFSLKLDFDFAAVVSN